MYESGQDAVNASEGTLQVVLDGRVEDLAVIEFEAEATVNQESFFVIGRMYEQHKETGLSGSGSLTVKYGTPLFTKILLDYERNRRLPPIRIVQTNADRGSSAGRQTIVYEHVKFNSLPLSRLLNDVPDVDVDFTYEKTQVLEKFNN